MKSSKNTTSWCQYLCCGLFQQENFSVDQSQSQSICPSTPSLSKCSDQSLSATVIPKKFYDPMNPEHYELEDTIMPPASTKLFT